MRTEKDYSVRGFTINNKLYDTLKSEAEKNQRSVSAEITYRLRQTFEEKEEQTA